MEFRILGPLEVISDGVRLDAGGTRNQKVLGALLLSAGQVVPLGRLVDVVWDAEPPTTCKHQIRKCVAELRAALPGAVITTDSVGYRIEHGDIDLRTFDERVARAHGLPAADAAAELRAALGLWRGPVLAGLQSRLLRIDAERMEERRLGALVRCLSLELELGRHDEVVAELTTLVAAHPFHEQIAGLLMRALASCGRENEARKVYEEIRGRLSDELGVDPGASLREVHQNLVGRPMIVTPAQLPSDTAKFTGRMGELAQLDGGGAVVISGIAGVGKTRLAVRWAHRVRSRYPDGQLYLDLRGFDDAPATTPEDALGQFLRALGVAADRIPTTVDEQAALYRSLVADRRMLVLLDNAATAEQVRPLLPGSPHCAVVITSRNDLTGLTVLDDVHQLPLDVLPPDEAHVLVGRVLGPSAEPETVATLARLCGYLPLAMRIAAANLAGRQPAWVTAAVAELAGDDRLTKLAIRGDRRAAVSAAFDQSYRALPPDAQRLFRLLGLLPHADFTLDAAAALVGEPAPPLDVLESASLIEPHTSGRYRMHDLVRLYARERVQEDDGRDQAWRRLLEFYLRTTDAALDLVMPDMERLGRPSGAALSFAGGAEALSWLEAERESIITCATRCAETGPHEFAWHLADALRRYFTLRRRDDDALRMGEAALRAAEAQGDTLGRFAAHRMIGVAHLGLNLRQCILHLEAAAALARALNYVNGEANCLHNLCNAYILLGQPDKATARMRTALELAPERMNHTTPLALGSATTIAGSLAEAAEHYAHALDYAKTPDDLLRQPPSLVGLADVSTQLGYPERARPLLDRAWPLIRESGSYTWEFSARRVETMLYRDTGQCEQALAAAERMLEASDRPGGVYYSIAALGLLGEILHHRDRHDEAVRALDRGLRLARATEKTYYEVLLSIDLARVLGTADLARWALEVARNNGLRVQQGRALVTLAHVQPGQTQLAEEALEIQRGTGHALGRAEALAVLGRTDEAAEIFKTFTGDRDHVPAGVLSPDRSVCPCLRY